MRQWNKKPIAWMNVYTISRPQAILELSTLRQDFENLKKAVQDHTIKIDKNQMRNQDLNLRGRNMNKGKKNIMQI